MRRPSSTNTSKRQPAQSTLSPWPSKFSAPTIVNRLGEYLVQQKMISSRQLDETLRRQDELRRKGKSFQLGELLIRFGVLSQSQLEKALDEQRTTFFSHMKR